MLVNISMPVYNTDVPWLEEAIQSVKNQTYKDWKLLIVDDCSTKKETIDFINSIKDQNIETIRTDENLGCDSARIFARNFLDKDCEFVAFMDSDDIMFPTRLEEQVNFLNSNKNVGILGGQMQMFVDRSLPFVRMDLPEILRLTSHPYNVNQYILSSDWVINNPSTISRRSIIDEFDIDLIRKIQNDVGLKRNVYGDLIFYSINAIRGVQIRNLSDIILFYRISNHNLSGKSWYGNPEKHKEVRKQVLKYYANS